MRNSSFSVDEDIKRLLKQFKLPDILAAYDDEIKNAADIGISHRELLHRLLKIEEKGKNKRLAEKNIKNVKFDSYKTIEEFNFKFQPSLNESKIKDLATLSFLDKKENVVFIGPPGVGKSHLSTSLGIKACERGKTVLFVNAIEFMDTLEKAYIDGSLKQQFKKLSRLDLLIIDELGYLKLDKEKESIFFQLIRHRYEKNSLILTTNLPFSQWGEIFTSEVAATAVLDRLLHHAHVISITGDTYRVNRNV